MSEFANSTLPGWEDTIRTPQDDGNNPVVSINYPERCKICNYVNLVLHYSAILSLHCFLFVLIHILVYIYRP